MTIKIYYVVYPNTESKFPQEIDVVTGWGGISVASGNQIVPSTSTYDFVFSTDAVGLSPSTLYKIAYVWYDDVGLNTSSVVTTTFTTTEATSGVPTLTAVTLYNVTTTTARPRVTVTF